MERRELLRTAGLVGVGALAGCTTGADSPGGGDPAGEPTDTTTNAPTDTTTPDTTSGDPWEFAPDADEPVRSVTVGEPDTALFPGHVADRTFTVWNDADVERALGLRVHAGGETLADTEAPLPAGAYGRVRVLEPADYEIAVVLDGTVIERWTVSGASFACNAKRTQVRVGPDGTVQSRTVQTTRACLGPTVYDHRIETTGAECGSGNSADVTFTDDALTVSGEIQTPTPCHRAVVRDAAWDDEAGRLRLTVGAEREDGACIDCIGVVDYELTLRFADTPVPVDVVHESMGEMRTVASASPENEG